MNKKPLRIEWDQGTIIIGASMISGYTYHHGDASGGGLIKISTPGYVYVIQQDVVGTGTFVDTVNKLIQIGRAAI